VSPPHPPYPPPQEPVVFPGLSLSIPPPRVSPLEKRPFMVVTFSFPRFDVRTQSNFTVRGHHGLLLGQVGFFAFSFGQFIRSFFFFSNQAIYRVLIAGLSSSFSVPFFSPPHLFMIFTPRKVFIPFSSTVDITPPSDIVSVYLTVFRFHAPFPVLINCFVFFFPPKCGELRHRLVPLFFLVSHLPVSPVILEFLFLPCAKPAVFFFPPVFISLL